MSHHIYRMVMVDWLCEAVPHRNGFRRKRAEHTVPDNKYHAHISVEILRIASMVNTVVGGSNHEILQNSHFPNGLCMYEDSVNLGS